MNSISQDGGLPSPSSCPSSPGASSGQSSPEEIIAKEPNAAVEESNDLLAVATRAEEPFKESVDDNTTPQGNIKEQSIHPIRSNL